MVHPKLTELFASAREHGKETLSVELQCKPIPESASMVHLFVFPFLSRPTLRRDPGRKGIYRALLQQLAENPRTSLSTYQDFVQDYHQRGVTDHTVLCQVLVPCDELFCVRDKESGVILQGSEQWDRVLHLVRMEAIIETRPSSRSWWGMQHTLQNWQITDVDDLLEGNLIL